MTTMTPKLIGFDEGGVGRGRDNPSHLRLVCIIEGGGKLAIWGKEGLRENIDKVLRAGLPCEVECDCRAPEEWGAQQYGHSYWIPHNRKLRVLSKQPATVSRQLTLFTTRCYKEETADLQRRTLKWWV